MYKISVVIPTLNRSALLAKTIDHIETQTLPQDQYEIIVVDNNSSDDTLPILEQKADSYANFRFSSQRKPGAAATRNLGLEMARGEIVLFIDDDIEAEPGPARIPSRLPTGERGVIDHRNGPYALGDDPRSVPALLARSSNLQSLQPYGRRHGLHLLPHR